MELKHPDDNLTRAAEEKDWATGHGEDSRRAEEAWDTFPGDSAHSVDYPDIAGEPTDKQPTEARDEEWPKMSWESSVLPLLARSLPEEPELEITVYATHPDGRRFESTFRQSFPEGTCHPDVFADAVQSTSHAVLAGFRANQARSS